VCVANSFILHDSFVPHRRLNTDNIPQYIMRTVFDMLSFKNGTLSELLVTEHRQ